MARSLFMIGALIILIAPLLVSADDAYQFIISGDPVGASTKKSCAVASYGTSLVTGALTASTVSTSLESRYRTWDESVGIALRSDKLGTVLILR